MLQVTNSVTRLFQNLVQMSWSDLIVILVIMQSNENAEIITTGTA